MTSDTTKQEVEESYSEHLNTSEQIQKSILEPNFDTALDYAEIGLDSFVEGTLGELPLVKTVVGVVKSGLKIKEIHFCKKVLTFLKHFHSGEIEDVKIEAFKTKFNSDNKYREKVLEVITVYNDRFIEVKKSEIFANLFLAYLNDKYEWDDLLSLTHCLEKVNISSIKFLYKFEKEETPFRKGYHKLEEDVPQLVSAGVLELWGTHLGITGHGFYLFTYGVKGDINYVIEKAEATEEE